MGKYKIYPKPQNIKYLSDEKFFPDGIKIIANEAIGPEAYKYAYKMIDPVLEINEDSDFAISISLNIDEKDRIDYYKLKITRKNIELEAVSDEACFYGLNSLHQILLSGELRESVIEDYADKKLRGLIEGYYGLPWTFEEREYLLKFGAYFKNNAFIFAPKDDPYHRDRWEDLYPLEDLEKISRLARLGEEYKNTFVWTIAPFFKNPITEENYPEKIQIIIEKFNQLYGAGVRQFGVLGDDLGRLDPQIPTRLMNDLSKWKNTREGIKDFLYCPGSYTLTWNWDSHELNTYTKDFPEDCHLFFTGRETCTALVKEDVEEFKNREVLEIDGEKLIRKDPVFWLNWPVNDIDKNYRKLYLGRAEMLSRDVDNIYGIVTNPMQEAYASLISIFAIADYAWNSKSFDAEQSWEDSFAYIDKIAPKELRTIAGHMSNIEGGGVGDLAESDDLADLIGAFEDSVESKLVSKFKRASSQLKNKYLEIIRDIEMYFVKSNFTELKENIKPYADALREKLEASVNYIDSLLALEDGQKDLSKALYERAENQFVKSNNHPIHISTDIRKVLKAEAGALRINPFLIFLKNKMDKIYTKKNISEGRLVYYPNYENSKSYRIPSLLRTVDDTVLAFAEMRNDHEEDWGNIDLVVRRKLHGEDDFGPLIKILDLQENGSYDKSAFVTNVSSLQDGESKRIFILLTAYPESRGFYKSELGNGYERLDGKYYLILLDQEGNKYFLKEGQIVDRQGKATGYKVELEAKQPFRELGNLYYGDKLISNVLFKDSPFRIVETSHILMTYSDDEGLTWSRPIDLNCQIKEDWMKYIGVAPGKGLEIKGGRLGFPAYYTNRHGVHSSCLIYSDDGGLNWFRGESPNDYRYEFDKKVSSKNSDLRILSLGESQAISLNNGNILLFMRNYYEGVPRHIWYASSDNRGLTFKNLEALAFESQSWSQLSAIHFDRNGREYILISQPSSSGAWYKMMGKLYLLEVYKDGSLHLITEKNIDDGNFMYSSLIDLGDSFGIIYEKGENLSGNGVKLIYREFKFEYLFEKGSYLKLEYKIYPEPKFISYLPRITKISGIEYNPSCHIDEACRLKIDSLLGYTSFRGGEKVYLNIDICEEFNPEGFIDYYELEIKNDEINIKADSMNGAFYGLISLEHILEQAGGSVRNLEIKDYANQEIRGLVEGYYGIPWGYERRGNIIKFASRFKSNVFVFAPKYDPYHREKWFEPYPDIEIDKMKYLIDLGQSLKTRFVWTIAPFKSAYRPISRENFDEGLKLLLNKFDQLYDLGVRQFGLVLDKANDLDQELVIELMKHVALWGKTKSDKLYDFIFFPDGYALTDDREWGSELDNYDREFPENIQFVYTGKSVFSPLSQEAIDDFKYKRTKFGERRDPVFWMNWPVNDVDRSDFRRIFMGKGEVYQTGVKNIRGTITNPMEEMYASLPAIFATADFAWNTEFFNPEKSWRTSFEFIDPDKSSSLIEIASHMSNADNVGILGLEESEELKNKIKSFEDSYRGEDFLKTWRYGNDLKYSYEKILKAIGDFDSTEKTKLKKEMLPYITNLYYKTKEAIELIDTICNSRYEKNIISLNQISLIHNYHKRAVNNYVYTSSFDGKNIVLRAESGTLRISKNVENMKNFIRLSLG